MPAGQLWATASQGGYMYSDELSDLMRQEVRATTKFRQMCDANDMTDKGLNAGEAAHWNVYSKINTNGTTLSEGTAMPEAGFTVRQGTATVLEWGNSIPFSSKVVDMAKHDVQAVVRSVLSRDCAETMDRAAHDAFNDAILRAVPTSGTSTNSVTITTNGTATATNSAALGKGHVKALVDTMKERNIPPFRGDDYVAIARPTTFSNLQDELESVFQYVTEGYNRITSGEKGRYYGCRFVEQTLIKKGTAYNGTAWTNGKSDWAFFCGADTVAEVIAMPSEVRSKIPGDYGRSHGIAWYAIEGFAHVHTDDTNARVIVWDSAA